MENEETAVVSPTELLPAERVKQRITAWLINYLANLTEIPEADIDIHSGFDRYGFDSYQGVVMTYELGEWLGSELDPSDTFDHPSVSELAAFLAEDPRHRSALLSRME